jgi:hypothetical protein
MSPRDLVAESFGKYGDTIQALRVVLAEFPDALVWYTFPQTRPNMWCSSGRDLYAKLASHDPDESVSCVSTPRADHAVSLWIIGNQ